MTTTVIVEAHCGEDEEVEVGVRNGEMALVEHKVLQVGEKTTVHVYDDRVAEVKEVKKNGRSDVNV